MAQTKNARYRVHNGVDFDTIHFETKAKQVKMEDGSTAENKIMSHLAQNAMKHITESGSNSNGRYIKFDDGTAICWHIMNASYRDEWTLLSLWTFPISFADEYTRTFVTKRNTLSGSRRHGSCYSGAPSRTSVNVGIASPEAVFGDATTHAVHVFAIGRWK